MKHTLGDDPTPPCEICGCIGNESCGHEPLGDDCSLDALMVCGCCRAAGKDDILQATGQGGVMKNLFKIVKPDLRHFKSMAKCYERTPKNEKEFWQYIIAYSDNEIARIEKNENRI